MAFEIGEIMKAICWETRIDSTADFSNFSNEPAFSQSFTIRAINFRVNSFLIRLFFVENVFMS